MPRPLRRRRPASAFRDAVTAVSAGSGPDSSSDFEPEAEGGTPLRPCFSIVHNNETIKFPREPHTPVRLDGYRHSLYDVLGGPHGITIVQQEGSGFEIEDGLFVQLAVNGEPQDFPPMAIARFLVAYYNEFARIPDFGTDLSYKASFAANGVVRHLHSIVTTMRPEICLDAVTAFGPGGAASTRALVELLGEQCSIREVGEYERAFAAMAEDFETWGPFFVGAGFRLTTMCGQGWAPTVSSECFSGDSPPPMIDVFLAPMAPSSWVTTRGTLGAASCPVIQAFGERVEGPGSEHARIMANWSGPRALLQRLELIPAAGRGFMSGDPVTMMRLGALLVQGQDVFPAVEQARLSGLVVALHNALEQKSSTLPFLFAVAVFALTRRVDAWGATFTTLANTVQLAASSGFAVLGVRAAEAAVLALCTAARHNTLCARQASAAAVLLVREFGATFSPATVRLLLQPSTLSMALGDEGLWHAVSAWAQDASVVALCRDMEKNAIPWVDPRHFGLARAVLQVVGGCEGPATPDRAPPRPPPLAPKKKAQPPRRSGGFDPRRLEFTDISPDPPRPRTRKRRASFSVQGRRKRRRQ